MNEGTPNTTVVNKHIVFLKDDAGWYADMEGTRAQNAMVNDAFATVAGKHEVRQLLCSILWVRYQIKDQEVFEKAYNYVEQYY